MKINEMNVKQGAQCLALNIYLTLIFLSLWKELLASFLEIKTDHVITAI